ncbi:MAG: TIM barrel protein [Verrucomicrobiales bacterium]
MISFSTCWNSSRHSEGAAVINEIRGIGFDTIEVSHGLKVSLLPGIHKAMLCGDIQISGVHNFCPSPVEVLIDAPDCYEFTSHRSYDRKRALDLTFATLENAASLGAKYAVLHMGSVPMKRISPKLNALLKQGSGDSRQYVATKLKLIKKRKAIARRYLDRAVYALEHIAQKAEEVGVAVAVESRSAFEDMPNEEEMLMLMDKFKENPWIGYWHDFGHVQRKHNQGLLDHEQWLATISPHLMGCHLHDVQWPSRDHRVPLSGNIDYAKLMPYVEAGKPVVWELSPSCKKSDIKKALPEWIARFGS